jgi:two-component system nitrate/nitrite response regulator NarL
MMGKLVGLLRNAPEAGMAQNRPGDEATVSRTAAAVVSANDPIHQLSPREREILALIAKGDSNKHIARALDIAETTVKIHVQHILRKLGLTNRVHAAVYATERGVI